MAEHILNTIIETLQDSDVNVLKLKHIYSNSKRNEFYSPNYEYTDYDQEIIQGESVLDCLLENMKRQEKILEEYEKILIKTKQVKQQFLEYFKKIETIEKKFELNIKNEIKEQENNFNILQQTIKKLEKINKIEEEKEKKNIKEKIENIKKEKDNFKKFEIKNIDFKKEKKKLEEWTKLKMKNIVFDSNIHNWKEDDTNFRGW